MLKDPRIVARLEELEGDYKSLGRQMGVDKKRIIEKIKVGLEATKISREGESSPDYIAINNAVNTWAKLTGDFSPEKKEVKFKDEGGLQGDPKKMTKEELLEAKEQILKEL